MPPGGPPDVPGRGALPDLRPPPSVRCSTTCRRDRGGRGAAGARGGTHRGAPAGRHRNAPAGPGVAAGARGGTGRYRAAIPVQSGAPPGGRRRQRRPPSGTSPGTHLAARAAPGGVRGRSRGGGDVEGPLACGGGAYGARHRRPSVSPHRGCSPARRALPHPRTWGPGAAAGGSGRCPLFYAIEAWGRGGAGGAGRGRARAVPVTTRAGARAGLHLVPASRQPTVVEQRVALGAGQGGGGASAGVSGVAGRGPPTWDAPSGPPAAPHRWLTSHATPGCR
jgi:hypothetical protein